MRVQFKEFNHKGITFLATGFICYNNNTDLPYVAQRADGKEEYFHSYNEALEFIGEGLNKPTGWTIGD